MILRLESDFSQVRKTQVFILSAMEDLEKLITQTEFLQGSQNQLDYVVPASIKPFCISGQVLYTPPCEVAFPTAIDNPAADFVLADLMLPIQALCDNQSVYKQVVRRD
jgi:hypothetical protein